MNWSFKNSIFLTKVCIAAFAVAYVAVLAACPFLVRLFITFSYSASRGEPLLYMVTIYASGLPIGVILWKLWKLIGSIGEEEIFTAENIARLRVISWMCFAVAFICLISMAYYVFWEVIASCMILMGLLIRVIKNVFENAKLLKDENDFTI